MILPPLAGLAGYQRAAQPGFDVESNVERLCRLAWWEKRLMETALYWLPSTPEWEAKEAFGLHAHLGATHVQALRARVREMRSPPPRMDVSPDSGIDRVFDEVLTAVDTPAKIIALYGVLRPALRRAYQAHVEATNPVADYPTCHMLRHMLVDEDEIAVWGDAAVQASADEVDNHAWTEHVDAYLRAAGGIGGDGERLLQVPVTRVTAPFEPDYFPQRDERFSMRWNFTNPQRQVSLSDAVPLDERTIALMCRRIVEMDVPEYMARIIAETHDEPWEFYVTMTRQLWDEVRHAMLGTVYFEARGVDWKSVIAIHPGMAIRLHGLSVRDAHTVLYAIEQNLMPGHSGKRLEHQIASNARDPLAAYIQDYDWADEVLHVHIGKQWLLPRLDMKPADAVKRGWDLRAQTAGTLDQWEQRGEQHNWWPAFVRIVLGHDTGMPEFDLTRR